MGRTVLVIGATGVLAPAAATLAARSDTVLGLSRGGGGSTRGVDARDPSQLAAALAGERWDDALVYAPAVSVASLDWLVAATPGRCVVVRTSQAADPAFGDVAQLPDVLQLGWTAERGWHTPEEISRAALEVLGDGQGRTLGVVRPWEDRP